MAGKDNLKPLKKDAELTESAKEKQRQIRSKGGKARAEKARKERKLKDLMKMALEMKEQQPVVKEMMKGNGWDADDIDQMAVITQGLIMSAKKGDVSAYNAIRDIMGEKPVDETKMAGGLSLDTNIQIGFVETDNVPASDESEVDSERE